MATDLKLPFSAGAETSSVSFDPRRQVAPAGDDEVTQVTQAGGSPALDVGSTIDAQFADGPPGQTQQDLNDRADAYVMKRKGVHKEYAQKSLAQQKLKEKAFQRQLDEKATKKMLLNRKANQAASMGAQSKRRGMWSAIDQAEAKHQILHQAKVNVAKTTDVRTKDTKTTNIQDTTVKDANVAVAADPSKKPAV